MHKTAHYRRAIWLDRGRTVEPLIRQLLRDSPDVAHTKFEYANGIVAQISARSMDGTGVGLYLTLFAEGEAAGTVENGGATLGRAQAPDGMEFLKTGIYLVVEGDHLAYLAHGQTNDGQISNLLTTMLSQHGFADVDTRFAFQARPNRGEIMRLLREGVKSIDLNISSFMPAAEEIADANPPQRLRAAGRAMADAIFGVLAVHRDAAQIEAAADIQANLHLGYDGRTAGRLAPAILTDIAEQAIEANDEFKIITRNDAIITRDKLVVKRDVNVVGDNISIEPHSAFEALRESLEEWRQGGILEN